MASNTPSSTARPVTRLSALSAVRRPRANMTDVAHIKRKFLQAERKRTERRIKLARRLVDEALLEQGRHLYALKRADELRLLVLFNWRDKHGISVLWMLRKLDRKSN